MSSMSAMAVRILYLPGRFSIQMSITSDWLCCTSPKDEATNPARPSLLCSFASAAKLSISRLFQTIPLMYFWQPFVALSRIEAYFTNCNVQQLWYKCISAEKELQKLFTVSKKEACRISSTLAEEWIQLWLFNSPAALYFRGLWEAAMKFLKHYLRQVLGDSTSTYEEIATFLAQVEACLNLRSLLSLSNNPEDMVILTSHSEYFSCTYVFIDILFNRFSHSISNKYVSIFGKDGLKSTFTAFLYISNDAKKIFHLR